MKLKNYISRGKTLEEKLEMITDLDPDYYDEEEQREAILALYKEGQREVATTMVEAIKNKALYVCEVLEPKKIPNHCVKLVLEAAHSAAEPYLK